jgi:D-arabinose 1-dehydrogenase-like Zn-dependent alcohol dehydrogenase
MWVGTLGAGGVGVLALTWLVAAMSMEATINKENTMFNNLCVFTFSLLVCYFDISSVG